MPPSQNQFNDQQKHYESLISLFKYCVGFFTVGAAIVAGFVGWFTYTNGKDMKESWKEERKEMKAQVDEMKLGLKAQEAELKAREEKMGHSLDYLMKSSNETIKMTREETINQIGSISNMATIEARNTIERIFRERNFDAFVEEIAEERMKPQIDVLVDKKMSYYETLELEKTNKAINDIGSPDRITSTRALIYLQLNQDIDLTEDQVSRILKILDNISDESIKQSVASILLYRKSNVAHEYFKRKLLALDVIQPNEYLPTSQILVVMSSDNNLDLSFYKAIMGKFEDKAWCFSFLVDNSCVVDGKLAIKILNSKEMVDMAFNSENIQNYKANFENNTCLKNRNLSETYFFKKAK